MFEEKLSATLLLTIKGTDYSIPGSNLERIELCLTSYGVDGTLAFWLADDSTHGGSISDKLTRAFLAQDLVEIKLSLHSVYQDKQDASWPLVVQGIGTNKRLHEETSRLVEDKPVMLRRYTLEFADPARVLWSQHFPCELFVDKTIKDIFEAYKGQKIKLSYDWTALTSKHQVLFVGLGACEDRERASFYDFLLWQVEHLGGFLSYDAALNSYKLASARSDPASATTISRLDVESSRVQFPALRRHAGNVLNSYTESAKKTAIANSQAVDGLVHDVLMRTPVTSRYNDRKTLETKRLKLAEHELELVFQRFPTVAMLPGFLYSPTAGLWSSDSYIYGKSYRLWQLNLRAKNTKQNPAFGMGVDVDGFELEMTARLELKDHPHTRLPAFRRPVYPVCVEGKIFSEEGAASDETFQVYTDSDTSLEQYKITIPLWNKQKAVAPFEPHHLPGQFFFPALKDARVLVAFDYQAAWIARYLEWRPGAQLPMDGQGNHILFGKSASSQTSLQHAYEENKPVFHLKRKNDKDIGLIQLSEGCMLLQVTEE